MLAFDMAMENGGEFLLRIEDIDRSRARPQWEAQIYDDLDWLGLWWPNPVMRQSDRMNEYSMAIEAFALENFLYPCSCSRADVRASMSAPQEGVLQYGPDGPIYPGTCRTTSSQSMKGQWDAHDTLRLNLTSFRDTLPELPLGQQIFSFRETGFGPNGETGTVTFTIDEAIREIGDIVLRRRDMGTSYHLSVVLDDAAQGITQVVRGQDLFAATKIHIILQWLLELPTPIYHHHKLIRDDVGKRLAKRDDARAISTYRAEGYTPQDIRKMVGL